MSDSPGEVIERKWFWRSAVGYVLACILGPKVLEEGVITGLDDVRIFVVVALVVAVLVYKLGTYFELKKFRMTQIG